MPTFFTWDYEETPATAGRGGEQRCEAGDRIVVPELGDCTLDKVEGVGPDKTELGLRPSDDGSAGCACAVVEEGISLTGDISLTAIELSAHDDCLVVVGSGQIQASGSDDQDLLRGAGGAESGFLGTRVAPALALDSSPEIPRLSHCSTLRRVPWYRPHSCVAPPLPYAQGKPPPTCSRRHYDGDLQDALASAPRAPPRAQDAIAPATGSRARLRRSVSIVRRSRRRLLL